MRIKYISALPGHPSTFWAGASGRWYRTKAQAEQDHASCSVNPEQYVMQKSFFAANKKTILITLAIVAIVCGGIYLYKKGTIVFHFKKGGV